jgi:hypothetical protein
MTVDRFPPPVVDHLDVDGRELLVVRDDLIPGGTKLRVLPRIMADDPHDEFVFGGPAQGYAQVALGHAAAITGKTATYFVARRTQLHPLTEPLKARAAKIAREVCTA